ncbi:hypothetical protein ESY86_14600 [Subsaximicrobium wynnwilliamsii]|uniref:Uncharacterized protein n=1 Tax=Subsaximicrobium wynnwilliamsii TaxID=291179 RepID=A0A5C6ZFZ0_9FLAO|nr:hypothetical protein [Subsaximicrobium wynnwilliamsii]TXD82469.1 hypothetical protein ESY87_14190 [Subsaximicrobium wynnwilliamsii]TXD88111.1 hypothetical protein ESY86_14600 [Subsaximicrobium wynnwilliamsii]TXE02027.1 hypothetical protein ESY88_13340 [Subsaximicrobium wynnwilliamsii]
MKNQVFQAILFILFSFVGYSQNDDTDSFQQIMDGSPYSVMTKSINSKEVKGSPYLYDIFFPAKIAGLQEKIFNVRYNAYFDEFEIKDAEDQINLVNKDLQQLTITFSNDQTVFISSSYLDQNNQITRGYFVVASPENQKNQLLIKKSKRYSESKPARSSYEKSKPAEFEENKDTYYLRLSDGVAKEIPRNKKDLANMYPKHSKAILDFIKKNRINTTEREDLVKLVKYLNSLQ